MCVTTFDGSTASFGVDFCDVSCVCSLDLISTCVLSGKVYEICRAVFNALSVRPTDPICRQSAPAAFDSLLWTTEVKWQIRILPTHLQLATKF